MPGYVPHLNLRFTHIPKVLKILKILKPQIDTQHEYGDKVVSVMCNSFEGINAFARVLLTQSIKFCSINKRVRKAGV